MRVWVRQKDRVGDEEEDEVLKKRRLKLTTTADDRCSEMGWDGMGCSEMGWDMIGWDGMGTLGHKYFAGMSTERWETQILRGCKQMRDEEGQRTTCLLRRRECECTTLGCRCTCRTAVSDGCRVHLFQQRGAVDESVGYIE